MTIPTMYNIPTIIENVPSFPEPSTKEKFRQTEEYDALYRARTAVVYGRISEVANLWPVVSTFPMSSVVGCRLTPLQFGMH